jgi:adenine deaminase
MNTSMSSVAPASNGDGALVSRANHGWDKLGLSRWELVDVALGRTHADVVIAGGRLVNVHTGRIDRADIAIRGNRIAATGDVSYTIGSRTHVIDATGRLITPGLVTPHFHQWHSNHNSTVVAQCMLERGCTALADGFYGPAIVAGKRGVRLLLEEMLQTPLKIIFLCPTHAWAQNRILGLPPAPNSVTAEDLLEMVEWPECFGLEETFYDLLCDPAVRAPELLAVVERALELRKPPTGHGVELDSERMVNAWVAAGIMNNHEAIDVDGAAREANAGLHVLHRRMPGSSSVAETARVNLEQGYATRGFQLCNDVAWADTIFEEGFDEVLREAIRSGLDPIAAVQMATIQPAAFYHCDHDIGVIAPGRFADLVLVTDLETYAIDTVLANGQPFVLGGERVRDLPVPDYPQWARETMAVTRRFAAEDLRVAAPCHEGVVPVRVIDIRDGEYLSHEVTIELPVRDGAVEAAPEHGVHKVVLIDRLRPEAPFGVGFVRGFGLAAGAMASASNPLTQGVVAVGADDADMATAVNRVIDCSGAFLAVRAGSVIAEFPTSVLGMTSDLPYAEARTRVDELIAAWREMGCTLSAPFAYLEFVAASTEPHLRISPRGLVRIGPKTGVEFPDLFLACNPP